LIIKDQLNRELSIDSAPTRVVSLVPSLTELLCDLGLMEKLVGVTKFCIHPVGIRKHASIIGGTKQVKIDSCLKLKADFILANKEENIEHQIESLSENGIDVFVSDISDHSDLEILIEKLGIIFEIENDAKKLKQELEESIESLESHRVNHAPKATYLIWKKPFMAAGGDTYISYILKKLGISNALGKELRYPTLSESQLKELDTDIILLSSEPYPFRQSHIEELTKLTGKKVILVDGEFFSWYGTRILHMKNYAKQLTSQL